MGTLTAIIPTFNRSSLLADCIDSILSQSIPISQTIVVNDGSTDDTATVISGFGDKITALHKENGGKSSALNVALTHVTSDYVWICDDDDIACPDGGFHLHAALEKHPDAPFAYGKFDQFRDEGGKRLYTPHPYYGRPDEDDMFIQVLEEMFAFQFAILARTESYRRTGPFREDLVRSQDFDMLARLARLGKPVFVPETIFLQREHAGDRGSAGHRFDASQAHANALRFSGQIIRDYRRNLPLTDFTPQFARDWSENKDRAAFLLRGLVCAQRSLWQEAIDDFEQAARLAGSASATADERTLPVSVVRSLMPWRVLTGDHGSVARLADLAESCPYGHQIATALSRPAARWAARQGRKREVATFLRMARLISGMIGPVGAATQTADAAWSALRGKTF